MKLYFEGKELFGDLGVDEGIIIITMLKKKQASSIYDSTYA
jgi:hypothetical protein